MTYKNILISLGIFIAIALSGWTFFAYRTPNITVNKQTLLPDGIMEEVNSLILNKQGKPSLIIVTPKLVHYAENDTSELNFPRLTLYRNSPEPWYISANTAKATGGTEIVNFQENVIIHHSADSKNPATIIKTPTLLVRPNKKTAETNDPITMLQPNTVIKGVGLIADLNTGDIKLLSQSRGEYVPNP